MLRVKTVKETIAKIFDESYNDHKWYKIDDYLILSLIVISTIEVFLTTFESIDRKYGEILSFIDYFTTIIFTIEVSLRIWVADIVNPKFKGFWGRVKYCFTFYGFVDFVSTYPFYLHFFFPIPYEALKAIRIIRITRVFRYMKSFSVLSRAMTSKKEEMLVSLQFLGIVTLILSFILYFVEHKAQPAVYDNGWISVVWAFAQYIGDPGGFADTPPITFVGKLIAVIIGVLGIAIFAVPAGLIGSAFSDVMEEDAKKERNMYLCKHLHDAFERKLDRVTGFYFPPKYVTNIEAQARLGLKAGEILDAINSSTDFRIVNLASTIPAGEYPEDRLAIELFHMNTDYGCCIDRNSQITIVAPSNVADPIIGHFAYYVAKMGGFNYISREVGKKCPYKSFFLFNNETDELYLKEYMDDLRRMTDRPNAWCWTILASSGLQEPEYPSQFHFEYGGKKGDETYDGEDLLVNDIETLKKVYDTLSADLLEKYGLKSDRQKYHASHTDRNYGRKLPRRINTCMLRIAWSVTAWNSKSMQIAKLIADNLNRNICGIDEPEYDPELKVKSIGYSDYKN